jgi:hypothetical protein
VFITLSKFPNNRISDGGDVSNKWNIRHSIKFGEVVLRQWHKSIDKGMHEIWYNECIKKFSRGLLYPLVRQLLFILYFSNNSKRGFVMVLFSSITWSEVFYFKSTDSI